MVTFCDLPDRTKGTRCRRCGFELPLTLPYIPTIPCGVAAAIAERIQNAPPRGEPGLGDILETALSSIGITKEWYVRVKERFDLPPTCDCEARKEWLNRVSDYVRGEPR